VGRIAKKAREIYDVVLDAQQAALREAKGGMWAKELDAAAREHIRAAGYGRYFVHGLGHGIGLRLHERPRISALSKERLLPGSIVTIEPGVYVSGVGGARIEDEALLTPTGCQVLTKAPKELIIL
jgi:Xaa-Pro aminopeptidase